MKKFLLSAFSALTLFAANSTPYFVSAGFGTVDMYNSKSKFNIAFGYKFYDPNIYNIHNRIYADYSIVNSSANFQIMRVSLDWIKQNDTLSPSLGLSIGYAYLTQNGNDYSTNIWGIDGGVIYNINEKFAIDAQARYSKAINKQDIWTKDIKELQANLIYNF